jgi:signal transduction histidine kinase
MNRFEQPTTFAAQDAPALPKTRGRLFIKYVSLFLAVVLVALVTSGGFEVWFSYQEHKASLVRIQREQAEAAAAKISQFVKEIESQLGWTTQLPWSAGTIEQRRFDGLRLLRQVPAITELAQLDSSGKEQLRVSRLAMDVVGSQKDFSREPMFTEAMAKKVYYGPVYFRRESEPYMTLALAGTRRDAGVSVGEVNLKLIWDVVSQIKVGERGNAYVVDAEGRLIAHPDISLVLRNTDLSRLAQVQAARTGETGDPIEEANNVQGRPVLTAHAPVAPLGWLVFVELPVGEAYEPLYASLRRAALLLLAGLVLAFLSGLLLARKMVVPIQALRAGAARIGHGDLRQRIAIKTGDELESLADQFNDMAGRLQDSYADLEKKVETRTAELSEALEQQTATSEVLQVISSSPGELEPVFDAILENATRICEAKMGVLFLWEGNDYRAVAVHGESAYADWFRREPMTRLSEQAGTPPLARLLDLKQVIHIHDLREDPSYLAGNNRITSLVETAGARTHLVVPMLKEDELIGAIVIYRQEVRPFAGKQIELLSNFAAQAVIAIENTRLLNELRESLDQQTATSEVLQVISSSPEELEPVFETMLKNAVQICGAGFGSLIVFEGDNYRRVALHNAPAAFVEEQEKNPVRPLDASPTLRRVAKTRQIVQVADMLTERPEEMIVRLGGARTVLCVPMLRDDDAIGVLSIYRKEVRPFTDKQIELVSNFAAQAVIAIENTRLLKELRQRTDELAQSVGELRALGEVSQAVNSTLDLETVLSTIVAKAVQLSGTDAGAIYVADETNDEFHMRATHGMTGALIAELEAEGVDFNERTIAEAVAKREPVQIPDLKDAPASPVRGIILRAGFRALLVLPLLSPDGIVGVLVVRRRQPGDFAQSAIDLLKTFAAQSVLAIQNAHLFREIEEKSRQLETASQHKSQFLANMSHELRTPLNAILGYTELITDRVYGEIPEKVLQTLDRVQKNGRHLLGLINDVLDLSKIEAGQLTLSLVDYSLKDVVHNVYGAVESLANAKKLALKVELPEHLPTGHGDDRRLTQVLLNLAGNAIKFTERGEIAIKVSASDGSFTVAVRDTGPGISAADQARIFEEFQQADSSITKHQGGTGLGLAIAKRMIEMHGGQIWVESSPGAGSIFSFRVPVNVQRQVRPS